MPREYSDAEIAANEIIAAHVRDGMIYTRKSVGKRREVKTVTVNKPQTTFGINNLWENTFLSAREKERAPASNPSAATESVAVKSATTDTTTFESTNATDSAIVDSVLNALPVDEFKLDNKNAPKKPLTREEFLKPWDQEIQGTGPFIDLGRNFVIALQLHAKQRNPESNPGYFNTSNLDYFDGPIPKLLYFLAKIVIAACHNYESSPLRAQYLIQLARYIAKQISLEEKLVSGSRQTEASALLKAFLSDENRVHLRTMDEDIRDKVAKMQGPELLDLAKNYDASIRNKTIELLFTFLHTGESQTPKDVPYLNDQWEKFVDKAKKAASEDNDEPAANLILLLMKLQIEASRDLILPEINKTKDEKDDATTTAIASGEYSDDEDEPTKINGKPTAYPTTEHVIKRGEHQVPIAMQSSTAQPFRKLTAQEKIKITQIIHHVLGTKQTLYIGSEAITPEALCRWGIVDPDSDYFKANDNKLIMSLLCTQTSRELLYRTLLVKKSSGAPKFLINKELEILKTQDEKKFNQLMLARWQILFQFFTYYCLNYPRLMLSKQSGQAIGGWGLFDVLAGTSLASFKLTETSLDKLREILSKFKDSVETDISETASNEEKYPRKWLPHLKKSLKLMEDIISDIYDLQRVFSDLTIVAEEWKENSEEKREQIKKLVESYHDIVQKHAGIMGQFLDEDTSSAIKELANSQDKDSQVRAIDSLSKKFSEEKSKISQAEQQRLMKNGVSAVSYNANAEPFDDKPILIQEKLTSDERLEAEKNEKNRIKQRKELADAVSEEERQASTHQKNMIIKGKYRTANGNGKVNVNDNNNNNNSNNNFNDNASVSSRTTTHTGQGSTSTRKSRRELFHN